MIDDLPPPQMQELRARLDRHLQSFYYEELLVVRLHPEYLEKPASMSRRKTGSLLLRT